MALQKNAQDVIEALGDILTPNAAGEILFGAQGEPMRLSQIEALSATRDAVAQGETIGYIVQPGGTGKTREGIALAYAMHQHGHKSLYVVPSQQALVDFAQKAKALCPDLDIGEVHSGEKRIGNLTFITYRSLLSRTLGEEAAKDADALDLEENKNTVAGNGLKINPKEYELVVWDEAHNYLTPNARKLRSKFEHAINVGLTATPRYYEGKELGGNDALFGEKFYELSVDKARERGEISDYENILVSTSLKTGLRLTSPDQEEGAAVAKAINIAQRNLLFADLYKNLEVAVTRNGREERHTLAGEPTILFAAGIDHTHDVADAINGALMPLLKTDEEFRSRLKSKGIDPDDPELVIAAPIHRGRSESHPGMELAARQALIKRYEQRKVLMLTATSLLQQSYDSPITSAVIDGVPRQTYVGAGQAPMRALRPKDGKFALLISTEDADHPTITFNQFCAERELGNENGVVIEDARRNALQATRVRHSSPLSPPSTQSLPYTLVEGEKLNTLIKKRLVEQDRIYSGNGGFRTFASMEYAQLNKLLENISAGDKTAEARFIEAISPWVANIAANLQEAASVSSAVIKVSPDIRGTQPSDKLHVREAQERLTDVTIDALMESLVSVRQNRIPSWSRFSVLFQNKLKSGLKTFSRENNEHELPDIVPVGNVKHLPHVEQNRPTANNEEFNEALSRTLRTLTPREERVTVWRSLEGQSREEVGTYFRVGAERIRQIEAKALRRLRHPSRARMLKPWIDRIPDQGEVNRLQNEYDNPLPRLNYSREARKEISAHDANEILNHASSYMGTIDYLIRMPVSNFSTEYVEHIRQETDVDMYALIRWGNPEIDQHLLDNLKAGPLHEVKKQFIRPEDAKKFDAAVSGLMRLVGRYKQLGGIVQGNENDGPQR